MSGEKGAHPLLEKAQQAPEAPGVYLFADSGGRVLYVGKARIIRRRVLSYFRSTGLADRTRKMLSRAQNLDFMVTSNEVEALILENNLIKKERPRFNIMLRDDKTYPYLKITTGEKWPRVELTRKLRNDGHRYFGPFMGQDMARRLMEIARTRFAVRSCSIEIDGKLARPCLYYHMNACLGPCVSGLTDEEAYAGAVEELSLFLKGRYSTLLGRLEEQMLRESEAEEFEKAAHTRDLITTVRRLREVQHVEGAQGGNADVIGIRGDGEQVTICLLPYRGGKLMGKREFHFEGLADAELSEILMSFLSQYYEANPAVPPVIECGISLEEEDRSLLEAWLSHRRGGRKSRIHRPRRGERLRWLEMAEKNARSSFELRFRAPKSRAVFLEERIAGILGLPDPVRRIECFDISHSSGRHTTASCVVWISGRMEKKQYRSFNIREVEGVDDFASISEAVTRRYRRRLQELQEMPDLILIDGGRGQLNAARSALDSLGLEIPLISLAKREEEIFSADAAEPLRPDAHDPAHMVLRRIRDEAHRFAITRQRKRRRKKTLSTELLNIPGVGPGRAKRLLQHFGSVRAVNAASAAELQRVLGPELGRRIHGRLHP